MNCFWKGCAQPMVPGFLQPLPNVAGQYPQWFPTTFQTKHSAIKNFLSGVVLTELEIKPVNNNVETFFTPLIFILYQYYLFNINIILFFFLCFICNKCFICILKHTCCV
eukprot:GHVR01077820.1.p1 GENE.GHVR01077820.1~~GHVR01077820.1.p1  ORF type:complete len:109 (-),score=1.85 GHVR01077820.1:339-665(-)